jgi:peptide deformylase
MACLKILEFPDPRLRTRARPVEQFGEPTNRVIDDMLETMYEANGIGLAATQVNIHQRIVVIDVAETRDQPQVFINPEIEILTDSLSDHEEGCLSVPEFREIVSRPDNIMVKALDRTGEPFSTKPEGLLAVCIQHELDHLNGKLFVDYLSPLKRQRVRDKLVKLQKQPA